MPHIKHERVDDVNRIKHQCVWFLNYIGNMKTLASRLIWARNNKKMSQAELAKKSGVSQSAIGNLEAGIRLTSRSITAIAVALEVDPIWLAEGKGQPYPDPKTSHEIDLENNPEYPAIKRVKLKLSAGISGFAVDLEGENHVPIVFGKYWYQSRGFKPEKLIAVRVRGQSMEPGLHENDTVVINTADTTPADGECFAINYEGEAVIKRLVRDAGEWWLSSDNSDQRRYPRKLCAGDSCIIIGRIVHKQSERI